MSYDVSLKDPITNKTIQLPIKHIMTGGIFAATYDENTKTFSPMPTSDAWLNITYNYSNYYYEATEGDPRFAHDEISAYYADGTTGPIRTEYGIRGLNGKTGLESITMLKDMISRIKEKYFKDNEWITTFREMVRYVDNITGETLDLVNDIIKKHIPDNQYHAETYTVDVNEGSDDNYWTETAVNAIKPLCQLIVMAELRPDGVWEIV